MDKVAKADLLVELSWEVCNKVGGIHTVLVSKAVLMQQYYPNYLCIGPYIRSRAVYEYQQEPTPDDLQGVCEHLRLQGIIVHYGHWRIKGEPKVMLLEFNGLIPTKDQLKTWFWERFGVDSLGSGWDFEEPLLWSWACSLLIEGLTKDSYQDKKIVTQHHEWMAGLSLLALKGRDVPVATVFTTHATMLGRSIAGHGEDIYSIIDHINPEEKAKELGVYNKHSTERSCAQNADVFTTVSEITGYEAEKFFGRKPDVLTLNGLDIQRFPTIEETSIKHVTNRDRLREYMMYHFFPHYHNFDLDHNIIMCIAGRYEYGNKGVDLFIEALARLNEELKSQDSNRTVTVFFWMMSVGQNPKAQILENKNYFRHIKNYVQWHSQDILSKVVKHFITSDDPAEENVYSKEFMETMKNDVLHFRRDGNPLVSAFNLYNEEYDPMMNDLRRVGLDNGEDDRVKVVAYPVFLDGNDGLLDLSYFDALSGCHFAVFPSYYEPWGYTPLEAAALGVPTVTTDAAGFGRFIKPELTDKNPGIYLVDRCGKSREAVIDQLHKTLSNFAKLHHTERVQNKINAKQASQLADWANFIKYYVKAHNLALEKHK